MDYDLVIRGGLVADGTGSDPREADVAISAGVIQAVGAVRERGAREIDAKGLLVTPGFVDLHTHYDGHAIWSSRLSPSSSHGVTTAVIGNGGLGFAPCRPRDREMLISTMEGVEDIPRAVMDEGLTWEWETFPDYLKALEARPRDIDVAAFVPHSAVRIYVMGDRGANREPASQAELEAMSAIVRQGVEAGAVGLSSGRTPADRRSDGEMLATAGASEEELIAVALGVRAAGGGLMQIGPENGAAGNPVEDEFAMLARVADAAGLPLTFSLVQNNRVPDQWRSILHMVDDLNKTCRGRLHPQYYPRSIGVIAGFDLTSNPFLHCPTYKRMWNLTLEQRVAELRKPEVRARIVSEKPETALLPLTASARRFGLMYRLNDPPDYEPAAGTSIAAEAARLGMTPEELAYDLLLENDGKATLLVAIANYADESLEYVGELFDHPDAVIGLGDGGAHCGMICDSSYSTFVLAHWARDRAGSRLSVGRAVEALSAKPARLAGLLDRGVIAPGYKADINIIDHAALRLRRPEMTDDLPGGGRRLDQGAKGYRWTIVAGEVIVEDDQPTGKLPGRLARRTAPAHAG